MLDASVLEPNLHLFHIQIELGCQTNALLSDQILVCRECTLKFVELLIRENGAGAVDIFGRGFGRFHFWLLDLAEELKGKE